MTIPEGLALALLAVGVICNSLAGILMYGAIRRLERRQ